MAQILLLEPDMVLNRIYTEALEQAGYKVKSAFDAQTAVTFVDQGSIDLIITELQLPMHNGVEFLYEFQSYPEWQGIPVIVQSLVSPQEFKSTAQLGQELGVVSYLYKPRTNLEQLLDSVDQQLAAISNLL